MSLPSPPSCSPVHLSQCNLAASFDFLGDRWSLLIVRSALFGVRRFDDFRCELGIPRNVLSARLKRLVERGIMQRRDYHVPGSRPRPEYVLTDMGQELRLPFLAMRQWADRWIGGDRPAPLVLVNRHDRTSVRVGYVDAAGRSVSDTDLAADIPDWATSPR